MSAIKDKLNSFNAALACDPISAFGGVVSCNFKITKPLASKLNKIFLEVIIANGFDKQAIKLLKLNLTISEKKNEEFNSLKQTILGIDFANPVGLAAGFDKNAEVIKSMLSYGFGFVEVGTITPTNPKKEIQSQRVFRLKEV